MTVILWPAPLLPCSNVIIDPQRLGNEAFLWVKIMFLKKESFEYDGEKTVLCELSGLQRIEYLAFISQKTVVFDSLPEDTPQQECAQAFMQMSIEINAWLISRSLSHLDKERDEDALYQQVLHAWSYDAISIAGDKVLALSGMISPVAEGATPQATSPEKP